MKSTSSSDSTSPPSSLPPPPPPLSLHFEPFSIIRNSNTAAYSMTKSVPNLPLDTHSPPIVGAGSTLIHSILHSDPPVKLKHKIIKRNTNIAHWLLTACTFAIVLLTLWVPSHKNDIVYPAEQQKQPPPLSYKKHVMLIAHILIKLAKLPFSPISDSALDDNLLVSNQLEFILSQLATVIPRAPPAPPPTNETQRQNTSTDLL